MTVEEAPPLPPPVVEVQVPEPVFIPEKTNSSINFPPVFEIPTSQEIVFDTLLNSTDKQLFALPKIIDYEENSPFDIQLELPSGFKDLIHATFID